MPGIEVEDELPLRVAADPAEERGAIVRVVDRAKARGSGDGIGRHIVVQVTDDQLASVPPTGLDHLRTRIDAEVAVTGQETREPPVTAREVEDGFPRLELRTERDDQLGTVRQIRIRVRIRFFRPARRLRAVLVVGHRNANRRSGCLRRKRSMARRCHRFRRVKKCLSITAWYSWRTTALGTHQRSHPAFMAR